MNEIHIAGLRVKTHIGVPENERANAQEIEIDIRIVPTVDFSRMEDDLSATVDYAAVCLSVEKIAASRPRQLIETLADEIAGGILADFAASEVGVEIRKFILPQTRHVGVRCTRKRP
jgi:dihydroneopterin aldolase